MIFSLSDKQLFLELISDLPSPIGYRMIHLLQDSLACGFNRSMHLHKHLLRSKAWIQSPQQQVGMQAGAGRPASLLGPPAKKVLVHHADTCHLCFGPKEISLQSPLDVCRWTCKACNCPHRLHLLRIQPLWRGVRRWTWCGSGAAGASASRAAYRQRAAPRIDPRRGRRPRQDASGLFRSQIFPQIVLCKKKILHHIKMSAHPWSTKCRWNQKLIVQFCCILRDEHFEPS
jgi:hypothetical protein